MLIFHLILDSDLSATHRWIKIDEDRARYVFAAVRLGKEGFERASVVVRFRHLGIETTVSLETML
jgi:hypothetical protein